MWCTDGVHQEVTSLGETTEEDDRFGRGEGDEVRAGFAEDSPRRFEDLECKRIASRSSVKDILTRDRVDIQLTELTCIRADGEVFASRTCYTRSRRVGLETALTATAAHTAIAADDHVTEFASEAIVPVDELTTDDDTTTDARTEGDDDEVLHTACSTIGHLTDSGSVSVVGECYGDTDAVLDHLSQGDLTLQGRLGANSIEPLK